MTNRTSAIEVITNKQDMEYTVESGDRSIVNFHAPWAGPCAQMNVVFAELHQQYSKVRFSTAAAEAVPEVTARYGISTVPTFLMFGLGRLVRRQDGADALKLCGHIEWLSGASRQELEDGACEMYARKGEVTVVMKGNAERPRCAFSKQMVEVLRKAGVVFESVDVLEEGFLREEMKRWAGWRTYPMLFARGKFVGGVEVVRELAEEKRLTEALEGAVVEMGRTGRTWGGEVVVDDGERVRRRMEVLTKGAQVMVFMKGVKEAPRCKYSKKVVALLKEQGVEFESVDVLADDEVRQGMKVFSEWPTFPQVYGGGNFVGGVDVVEELAASGDLKRELGLEEVKTVH